MEKFRIPSVIDPTDSVCVQIQVPNDPAHFDAFWSALYELGQAYNWENDGTGANVQVAEVWDTIWSELQNGNCPVISFRAVTDTNPLTMQYTTDGVTYNDLPAILLGGTVDVRRVNTPADLPTSGVSTGDLAFTDENPAGTVNLSLWECSTLSGSAVWTQLGAKGDPGSNGTNGTNGITPQLRDNGTYIQVSYDGGATWANLVALSEITGPQGGQGVPGVSDLLPPILPESGDAAVTFTLLVESDGTFVPYIFPSGYNVKITPHQAAWGWQDNSQIPPVDYVTSADGTALYTINSMNAGRMVAKVFSVGSTGQVSSIGSPIDALSSGGYTTSTDDAIELLMNSISGYTIFGSILVDVTITPPITNVTISYLGGFGAGSPTNVNLGDSVTIAGTDAGGGFLGFEAVFSIPVRVTVTATANYVNGTSSDNTMMFWNTTQPTDANPHNWTTWYPPSSTQAQIPVGNSFDNIQGFGMSSNVASGFTVTLHIQAP